MRSLCLFSSLRLIAVPRGSHRVQLPQLQGDRTVFAVPRGQHEGPAQPCQTEITDLIGGMLRSLREHTDAPFLVHNASGLPLDRIRRHVPFVDPIAR